MQTFMPYPDYRECARVLDNRRLGKQRVEALQILNSIEAKKEDGWANHPATLQWVGYKESLRLYINAMIDEWVQRGFENNMARYTTNPDTTFHPPWASDPRVHLSHRSNLLRKDPAHYSQFKWGIVATLDYFWPVTRKSGLLSREKVDTNLTESEALIQLQQRSKIMAQFIAVKNLDSKESEVRVYNADPDKILDNEWSVFTVTDESMLAEVPMKILLWLYNKATGQEVKKFSDRKSGAARTLPYLAQLAIDVVKEKPAKKGKVTTSERKSALDDQIIVLKVEKNPKRPSSKAFDYFELLMKFNGKTVKEFRTAGLKKFGGYESTDDKRVDWTAGEIRWCLKQNFIELKDAA